VTTPDYEAWLAGDVPEELASDDDMPEPVEYVSLEQAGVEMSIPAIDVPVVSDAERVELVNRLRYESMLAMIEAAALREETEILMEDEEVLELLMLMGDI
jgi:hypothetical protein